MIVYHGSFLEVVNPDLIHSHPNLDFGSMLLHSMNKL